MNVGPRISKSFGLGLSLPPASRPLERIQLAEAKQKENLNLLPSSPSHLCSIVQHILRLENVSARVETGGNDRAHTRRVTVEYIIQGVTSLRVIRNEETIMICSKSASTTSPLRIESTIIVLPHSREVNNLWYTVLVQDFSSSDSRSVWHRYEWVCRTDEAY